MKKKIEFICGMPPSWGQEVSQEVLEFFFEGEELYAGDVEAIIRSPDAKIKAPPEGDSVVARGRLWDSYYMANINRVTGEPLQAFLRDQQIKNPEEMRNKLKGILMSEISSDLRSVYPLEGAPPRFSSVEAAEAWATIVTYKRSMFILENYANSLLNEDQIKKRIADEESLLGVWDLRSRLYQGLMEQLGEIWQKAEDRDALNFETATYLQRQARLFWEDAQIYIETDPKGTAFNWFQPQRVTNRMKDTWDMAHDIWSDWWDEFGDNFENVHRSMREDLDKYEQIFSETQSMSAGAKRAARIGQVLTNARRMRFGYLPDDISTRGSALYREALDAKVVKLPAVDYVQEYLEDIEYYQPESDFVEELDLLFCKYSKDVFGYSGVVWTEIGKEGNDGSDKTVWGLINRTENFQQRADRVTEGGDFWESQCDKAQRLAVELNIVKSSLYIDKIEDPPIEEINQLQDNIENTCNVTIPREMPELWPEREKEFRKEQRMDFIKVDEAEDYKAANKDDDVLKDDRRLTIAYYAQIKDPDTDFDEFSKDEVINLYLDISKEFLKRGWHPGPGNTEAARELFKKFMKQLDKKDLSEGSQTTLKETKKIAQRELFDPPLREATEHNLSKLSDEELKEYQELLNLLWTNTEDVMNADMLLDRIDFGAMVHEEPGREGETVKFLDIKRYIEDFETLKSSVSIVGGIAERGEGHDIDWLIREPVSNDEFKRISFRIYRMFPPEVNKEITHHFVRNDNPFTNHIPIYNRKYEKHENFGEIVKMDKGLEKEYNATLRDDGDLIFSKEGWGKSKIIKDDKLGILNGEINEGQSARIIESEDKIYGWTDEFVFKYDGELTRYEREIKHYRYVKTSPEEAMKLSLSLKDILSKSPPESDFKVVARHFDNSLRAYCVMQTTGNSFNEKYPVKLVKKFSRPQLVKIEDSFVYLQEENYDPTPPEYMEGFLSFFWNNYDDNNKENYKEALKQYEPLPLEESLRFANESGFINLEEALLEESNRLKLRREIEKAMEDEHPLIKREVGRKIEASIESN